MFLLFRKEVWNVKRIFKLFGKFFDIDTPADIKSFWISVCIIAAEFAAAFLLSDCDIYWDSSLIVILCLFLIVSGGVFFFSSFFRRLKNYGFSSAYVLREFIKIFMILFLAVSVFASGNWILGIKKQFYMHNALNIFFAVCGIICLWAGYYLIRFLICGLFLKGKDIIENEKEYSKTEYWLKVWDRMKCVLRGFYKFFAKIFDYRGRTDRYEFFLWGVLSVIVWFVCEFFSEYVRFFEEIFGFLNYCSLDIYSQATQFYAELGVHIFIVLFFSSLYVRRARDLGLNPWYCIFMLLPFCNIIVFMVFIFGKTRKSR